MGKPSIYSKETIKKIQKLASKGFTDTEIAEKTNASYSFTKLQTTKYWEEKMKQKEK